MSFTGMEGGRTHFNSRVFQSGLEFSLGEMGKFREDLLQLVEKYTSACESRPNLDGGTHGHLPVVDGIGVLEDIEESSNGRVLHVEGETGVAILELLDGLAVVLGVALEGHIRTKIERRVPLLDHAPWRTWRRTWTWWMGRRGVG